MPVSSSSLGTSAAAESTTNRSTAPEAASRRAISRACSADSGCARGIRSIADAQPSGIGRIERVVRVDPCGRRAAASARGHRSGAPVSSCRWRTARRFPRWRRAATRRSERGIERRETGRNDARGVRSSEPARRRRMARCRSSSVIASTRPRSRSPGTSCRRRTQHALAWSSRLSASAAASLACLGLRRRAASAPRQARRSSAVAGAASGLIRPSVLRNSVSIVWRMSGCPSGTGAHFRGPGRCARLYS